MDKSCLFQLLAETDYLAFRNMCLLEQPAISLILFAGQQTIEKSLKAIILLHGGKTNNFGHDLLNLYNEAKKLEPKLQRQNTAMFDKLITEFNGAEFSRYASSDIRVEELLHKRLDTFFITHLRKAFYDAYYSVNGSIRIPDKFTEILTYAKWFPNSHHALTFDNQSLGFTNPGQISTIRPISYKIKPVIILGEQECKNQKELEKRLGIRISNTEFQQTFLLEDEEQEVLESPDLMNELINRRNQCS